ncbi:MAG TPA: hypothetical protein DEB73_03940 [Candidatus Magasanikbacteria bacterium]|uniref:Uncharacterized protein n=2 Tax=Candidatus Magasanikiibacteriota TaxID=1752731 RepID=A0A0G0ZHN0_9BACT|nr:MAG: hypothetical protein UU49_C0023G0011 [Candidatus Magasanikbacteria bacterium GW2011_GWC2_41_17]KKS12543.1 MAG: hypothetical protein UU69_C0032G0007 [Candidatus Magasanikbacteria bacterium GW2011_GWA2_41_55]HBV58379.1 hypothetical protein [Candidatus Magasanikbacteria bacterium]HBX16414.1 hypothetical protein [Candidatus Magasanikbacteria bacterium]
MGRFPVRLFLRDKFVISSLGAAVFVNVALWVYLLVAIKSAENIFLHYTIHFGVDLVGTYSNLLMLPLLGLVLILLNFTIAYFFYDNLKRLGLLMAAATPLIQVFLLVEGFFLAFLNR